MGFNRRSSKNNCVELVAGICLNTLTLYILLRQRKCTVGDLLLIDLCMIQGVLLVWELVYTSPCIDCGAMRLSEVHATGLAILYRCTYQLMIYITVDGVLTVELTMRYQIIVTKRKALVSFIILDLL